MSDDASVRATTPWEKSQNKKYLPGDFAAISCMRRFALVRPFTASSQRASLSMAPAKISNLRVRSINTRGGGSGINRRSHRRVTCCFTLASLETPVQERKRTRQREPPSYRYTLECSSSVMAIILRSDEDHVPAMERTSYSLGPRKRGNRKCGTSGPTRVTAPALLTSR